MVCKNIFHEKHSRTMDQFYEILSLKSTIKTLLSIQRDFKIWPSNFMKNFLES